HFFPPFFLKSAPMGASPLHYAVACFTYPLDNSVPISHALRSCRIGAMGAAVKGSVGLYPVPNDLAAAVLADWGESGDGTFNPVEHMRPASQEHLKGLIVLVAAHFALCHA